MRPDTRSLNQRCSMYAIEFHFALEREATMPSPAVIEDCFRRTGERGSGRIEHVSVNCGPRDAQVVAFVTADSEQEARRFARIAGGEVVADLKGIRLCRFHLWRDDRL